METQEMRDRKSNFVLWVYWAAGQPLERHQRDYVAYLTEMQLRERGLTSGYNFTDGANRPLDTAFNREAVSQSTLCLLDGPGRTDITHITKRGEDVVKYVVLERIKAWLGSNYNSLENYVRDAAKLEREELIERAREVSKRTELDALAAV